MGGGFGDLNKKKKKKKKEEEEGGWLSGRETLEPQWSIFNILFFFCQNVTRIYLFT